MVTIRRPVDSKAPVVNPWPLIATAWPSGLLVTQDGFRRPLNGLVRVTGDHRTTQSPILPTPEPLETGTCEMATNPIQTNTGVLAPESDCEGMILASE